eukprot:6057316-Prymnesium_polylepis.3
MNGGAVVDRRRLGSDTPCFERACSLPPSDTTPAFGLCNYFFDCELPVECSPFVATPSPFVAIIPPHVANHIVQLCVIRVVMAQCECGYASASGHISQLQSTGDNSAAASGKYSVKS